MSEVPEPGDVRGPTGLVPARTLLARFEPRLCGLRGLAWRWLGPGRRLEARLRRDLAQGELGAACVVSEEPLVVATYADELDAACLLHFPSWLASERRLRLGERLLCVNHYRRSGPRAPDLVPGPLSLGRAVDVHPILADFVAEPLERVAEHRARLGEEQWQRCWTLGLERWEKAPECWRDGNPLGV